MNSNDPLEILLVSESQAIDRQELASLLQPYLSINKETKLFDFSGDFMRLPNAYKILIVLSAVKARSLILKMDDKIAPSEIIKMEVAPEGSIKATLKGLIDSREIKSEKGKYFLPNYKVPQVVARFKKLKSE